MRFTKFLLVVIGIMALVFTADERTRGFGPFTTPSIVVALGASVELLDEVDLKASITASAISPDGRKVAVAYGSTYYTAGNIQLFELSDELFPIGTPLTGHEGSINDVQFSWDRKYLASSGYDGTIRIWNIVADSIDTVLTPTTEHTLLIVVGCAAFSPDGEHLVSGDLAGGADVWVWDIQSKTPIKRSASNPGSVGAIAFSPNGQYVAYGGFWYSVILWEFDLQNEMPTFIGWPASGQDEWRDNRALRILRGHESSVRAVQFSPDSAFLASGSGDGTVRVWEVQSGDLVAVFGNQESAIESVAWSPTGRWLISTGETIHIWDSSTNAEVLAFGSDLPDGDHYMFAAFDGSGSRLVAATQNGLVQVWRITGL